MNYPGAEPRGIKWNLLFPTQRVGVLNHFDKIKPAMRKIFLFLIMALFMNNGMAQKTRNIAVPFSISVDPMQRLLLVNLEKDPDTLYTGFEPQVFDDRVNGKGHLVIGWRVE